MLLTCVLLWSMAAELIQAVALLVSVLVILAVLPKLLWRDWTRNSPILRGGGGGRRGGGLFGVLLIGAVVRGLVAVVIAVAAAVGAAVVALVDVAVRGTGSMWRWGVTETARRATDRRRDADGLEDLWRRS